MYMLCYLTWQKELMCIIKLRTWRWGESLFWIISGGPMLSQWFLKLEEEGRIFGMYADFNMAS